MKNYKTPIKVKGERVWRTYIGGRELDRLQRLDSPKDSHFPEIWMFSTTKANNTGREHIEEGICYLEDASTSLKALIENDPIGMLGESHYKNYKESMGILIKLIDSKERLTVQVHPDKEKAMKLFNSRFGKTECWHILGVRNDMDEPPHIYMGFKENITREVWEDCFKRQDYAGMLSLMHKVEVREGETYIIYGGVPHAIGAGCMLLEIQEPTDYTIRVEKVTPSGFEIADEMCHQGIGFEKMFECFYYEGKSQEESLQSWCLKPKVIQENSQFKQYSLVDYNNTECFKMEKIIVSGKLEVKKNEFSCLYVLDGNGTLISNEEIINLQKNGQVFVPASSIEYTIENKGSQSLTILKMNGPKTK